MPDNELDKVPLNSPDSEKRPLSNAQEFLKQIKVCAVLLRDILLEVKDLVVVIGLIAFFIWGFAQLFQRLH